MNKFRGSKTNIRIFLALISYEIRKVLCLNYIKVIIAIIFIVNIAVTVYTCRYYISNDSIHNYESALDYYISDNASFMSEYNELLKDEQEKQKIINDRKIMQSIDNLPTTPVRFFELDYVINTIGYINGYNSNIDGIIKKAQDNILQLHNINTSDKDYKLKYQSAVIDIYENVKAKTQIGLEIPKGWNIYFNYKFINFFVFLSLLFLCSCVFTIDNETKINDIVRTTKNGRVESISAKIIVTVIFTLSSVIILNLASFISIGFVTGYSSVFNMIQIFPQFINCHIPVSVGVYLVIFVLLKMLVFLFFSLLVAFLSAKIKNRLYIFISMFAFYAVNLFFSTANFLMPDNPLKLLNIIGFAEVNVLLTRFRALNIFNNVIGVLSIGVLIYIFIIVIFSISAFLAELKGNNTIISKIYSESFIGHFTNKFRLICVNKEKQNKKKPFASTSLVFYEFLKIILNRKTLFFLCLILMVKFIYEYNSLSSNLPLDDEIYRDYTTKYSGILNENTLIKIDTEGKSIYDNLSKKSEMDIKYQKDEISLDEYSKYINDYWYSVNHLKAFDRLNAYKTYLIKIKQDYNIDAYLLYDDGYLKLFSKGSDIFFVIILLLLFSGIVSDEYVNTSGSIIQIIKPSKRGRADLYYTKYKTMVFICFVLFVIFSIYDLISISVKYGINDINQMAMNIFSLDKIGVNISIMQFMVLFFMLKMLAYIILMFFIIAFSSITRNNILTLIINLLILYIPQLLIRFMNLNISPYSFESTYSIFNIMQNTLENNKGYISTAILLYFSYLILAFVLFIISNKKYCR